MQRMKELAQVQVDAASEFASNHKHGFDIRTIMFLLTGIIFALLYIGDCIKETKNAK